jgi:5-methylcytosine-specific restriction endonuclease McrA
MFLVIGELRLSIQGFIKSRLTTWRTIMARSKASKYKKYLRELAKENYQKAHPRKYVQVAGVDVREDAFLKTFEWRRVRMTALVKYGARCQCCGASPATGAVMHVDHIKPRRTHPELALDPENLQILCEECNHGKGSLYDTDWRHQQAEDEIDPAIAAHLREIMSG